MSANGWRIVSTTPTPSTDPPSRAEMEALLPSSWPDGWEELGRDSGDGQVWLRIGHISPDPNYAAERGANHHGLMDTPPGLRVSRYDFTADLRIAYVDDSETLMLDLNDVKSQADTELAEARDLLESVGDELTDEERDDLRRLMAEVAGFVGAVEENKYLGERARTLPMDDGDIGILSVSIGRLALHGSLIGSDRWPEPESTRIHSVKCYRAHEGSSSWRRRCGKPCSTLAQEGFVTKEAVERLLRGIFAGVKGEQPEEKDRRAAVVITRQAESIEDPEQGFEFSNGDTVETRGAKCTLEDRMGNELTLENDTRVAMAQDVELEQFKGEMLARIRSLTPDQIRIRTPQAVLGVRGTTFNVRVEDGVTTLTVHEGEVEFTDLHGNAVTVNADERCTCSAEHGLSLPTPP